MEKRLSALRAASLATKGMHADGGSLYLKLIESKDNKLYKSWVFKFRSPETGKLREMGLGSFEICSLAEARTVRDAAKNLIKQGIRPHRRKKPPARSASRICQARSSKVYDLRCVRRILHRLAQSDMENSEACAASCDRSCNLCLARFWIAAGRGG
jgi:Arm DNA-binding domain